jgi:type I restriction enzyme S subunit
MKRWPTKSLGELLVAFESGSRPKGGVVELPDGIPSISGEHIDGEGQFIWENPKHITREFYSGMRRGRIERGDILVVKDGATTGKTAMVRDSFPFREAAINEHVFLLRVDKAKVSAEFAGYFLFSPLGQQQILSSFHGAAIGGIAQDFVRNVHVPLAPLTEQERIVKLLDGADELRKLRARADRRTAEFIPALFYEMFGDVDRFPVNSLNAVAEVVSGVAKGRRFNGQQTVVVPYVRVANVQAGYLDLTELKTIEALPEEVDQLSLRRGDVLLTEGGDFDKLGRGAMLEQDLPTCIHQKHVFRVRCNQQALLPDYFAKFLLTPAAKSYFLRCAKKTSNLASINMTQLRALPVPVPPLSLQREFAARLAEMRALEQAQAESRRRLDALFASLLDRAFKGEL